MLSRKLYQFSQEGRDVWLFLRDRGTWIERCTILEQTGDLVIVRYETEDEDEICSWEEIIRLESIGAVAQRLSTIPKGDFHPSDLPTAEDYPDFERIEPHEPSGDDEMSDKTPSDKASPRVQESIDNGHTD
ncbi:MAG: DUF6679 family protein [Synechococcus sp.]